MKKNYFTKEVEKTQQRIKSKVKEMKKIATCRMLTFFFMIFGMVWGFREKNSIGWLLGLSALIIFVRLVYDYENKKRKCIYEQTRKKILEKYLSRFDDSEKGWKSFEEQGKEYLQDDMKVKDLDLLGRASLYQYLCVCHTPFGKKKLADALSQGCHSVEEIKRKQEAVKELILDQEFAIHLQTISCLMEEQVRKADNSEGMISFVQTSKGEKVTWTMKVLSYLIPFVTLFALVSVCCQVNTVPAYIVMSIGILLQMGISFLGYNKNSSLLGPVYEFTRKVKVYESFLKAIEDKEFQSDYLKELQLQLRQDNGGALQGLKALQSLSSAINVRYNGILYSIVASLLMWDIHCKDALFRWREQYGESLKKWMEVIGEIENLLSLAVMGQTKENYCFPQIQKIGEPYISFTQLMHPLLQEDKAVGNNFSLCSGTCIITGSNMSGKTTFLRSIGVNLSLAYAGSIVLGDSFDASLMAYFTSMRVEDRVDQGISTFYAEILRIKEMVEYSQQQKPMLVMIDEIFKGTNSKDRILGAQETIKKLSMPWVNVMVSTHDFELCHLGGISKRQVLNYHFEEYYKDNHILFDYHLRKGPSTTTNAQYLLRMAGIIDG